MVILVRASLYPQSRLLCWCRQSDQHQSRNMAVMNVSERCLASFFSSPGQMLDMEISLTNQTEEQNNILDIIYGQFQFHSFRFT